MDMQAFERIFKNDLPDLDKLALAFAMVTQWYVDDYTHQVDLLNAVQDREALIKEQIKLEMMKHARGIFADCFYRVAGRKPWDG